MLDVGCRQSWENAGAEFAENQLTSNAGLVLTFILSCNLTVITLMHSNIFHYQLKVDIQLHSVISLIIVHPFTMILLSAICLQGTWGEPVCFY